MKSFTIAVAFFLFSHICHSQNNIYGFLNDIFEMGKDTTYVISEFNTILPSEEYNKYFDGESIEEIWGPDIRTENEWPSLALFLDNISLYHFVLHSSSEFAKGFDKRIKFENLKGNFKESSLEQMEKGYPTKNYLYISRPFFSCNNQWAMISITSIFSGGAGSDTVYIYRKVMDEWSLYHKLPLNLK